MSTELNRVLDAIDDILAATNDAARTEAANAAKRIAETEFDALLEAAGDTEEMEAEFESQTEGIETAVHRLLDEVRRPVGTQTLDVPKSPAVDRALLGLHDAIGRSL